MKVTPFYQPGINQFTAPMGIDFHLVPGVHALFFGPVECARHTYPQLVDDPDASLLIVNDVQASLGVTEDLVREAVAEIAAQDPDVRAFILCTACQTAFMGIDLEGLCTDLHAETGLYFGHIEANRMSAENIPGKDRKNMPGGDRYHSRLALFRMLKQVRLPGSGARRGRPGNSKSGGIAVLTADALDADNEVLRLAELEGVSWVRGVGDCHSFEEFLDFADARVAIATSMAWKEVGEWMLGEFGIPLLYLPTSYSLEEVDAYYDSLLALLAEQLGDGAGEPPMGPFREMVEQSHDAARRRIERTVAELHRIGIGLELDLRLIDRPFSLVEALEGYGFEVRDFLPSMMKIQHKEADDLPAYERLREKDPALGLRFAARPGSPARSKRATRTKNLRRPGRWVQMQSASPAQRVPEETAWWGYASIEKLMDTLDAAFVEQGRGA